MKTLILILSVFLIFSYGCGSGEEDSTAETETQVDDNDPANDDDDNVVPSSEARPPVSGSTISAGGQDPCENYRASCGTDLKLCSEKYLNCLKPKAGPPATTKTVTCTKQDSKDIVIVVNEWNNKPGTNNLLCEFLEDKILYLYATNSKNECNNELNRRKKELASANYQCN